MCRDSFGDAPDKSRLSSFTQASFDTDRRLIPITQTGRLLAGEVKKFENICAEAKKLELCDHVVEQRIVIVRSIRPGR